MSWAVAAAAWHVLTHELLAFASVGIAASTIDDLVVDFLYFRLVVLRRMGPLPAAAPAALTDAAPTGTGWMAILIPAWDEAAVIAAMLSALTRRLDYPWYVVFVGVYPNDPATRAEIVSVVDARIRVVACDRAGPTTKADCLNHLWRAAVEYEAVAGVAFKAVVLHDAEDVVDAAELHVFNAHIPALAMVQLPVVPLADPRSRWVSGHYLDEFAEAHRKDVVVRGMIGASVPSAGVACAIDRRFMGRLAGSSGSPFDATSMTEDYEIGMRIAALGGRGALLRVRGSGGTVVTREHFPATFETAVRQKTRWLLGIALDGWDRVGWRTGVADRFMLFRDRKTIVAPFLVGAAYAAVAMAAVDAALRLTAPAARAFPPLVGRGSLLAFLLFVNTASLGWRLALRAGFTGAVYGWREGVRAVPRTVIANAINATAAARAVRRYFRIRAGHETPHWDKTAHQFPSDAGTPAG
jgi:adsorption protein B